MGKRCGKCGVYKSAENFHLAGKLLSNGNPKLYAYCKPCGREIRKAWLTNNRGKCCQSNNMWRKRNPVKQSAIRKRNYLKLRSDLNYVLNSRLRSGLQRAMKSGLDNKSTRFLPFTIEELKKHLEKQFVDGMTWNRFLNREIHIDHIRPLSSFHFTSSNDVEFLSAWSLANLRPLWAIENVRKKDKRLFLI